MQIGLLLTFWIWINDKFKTCASKAIVLNKK